MTSILKKAVDETIMNIKENLFLKHPSEILEIDLDTIEDYASDVVSAQELDVHYKKVACEVLTTLYVEKENREAEGLNYYKNLKSSSQYYFPANLQDTSRDMCTAERVVKYFAVGFGYGLKTIGLTEKEAQKLISRSYSECYVRNTLGTRNMVQFNNKQWVDWIKEGYSK